MASKDFRSISVSSESGIFLDFRPNGRFKIIILVFIANICSSANIVKSREFKYICLLFISVLISVFLNICRWAFSMCFPSFWINERWRWWWFQSVFFQNWIELNRNNFSKYNTKSDKQETCPNLDSGKKRAKRGTNDNTLHTSEETKMINNSKKCSDQKKRK